MAGYIAVAVILAILLFVLLYVFVIRPWHMRWGTTDEEKDRPLPGDSLLPRASVQVTHAIAIHGSAEDIWPWLIQMGQRRGEYYSYAWLENLAGCPIKNADRLIAEWQHLQVGGSHSSAS